MSPGVEIHTSGQTVSAARTSADTRQPRGYGMNVSALWSGGPSQLSVMSITGQSEV